MKSIFANPILTKFVRGAYLSMIAFMIASYAASAINPPSPPPAKPVAESVTYWIWT